MDPITGAPDNPLLTQIRQQRAMQPDTPPPSLLPPPGMDQGAPPIMQTPQPNVKAPRGSLQGEQDERNRLVASKPGANQVYGDITNSGFGQNHPLAGKLLGGAAQGLASLGNIALGAVSPRLASLVPGTSAHHAALLGQEDKNIDQMQGEQQKTAQTGLTNTEAQEGQERIPQIEAQTAETTEHTREMPEQYQRQQDLADAQIQNLLHPQAKTDFESWRQQNPNAPVADWIKLQASTKNVRPDTPEQQFIDEFTQKNPNGTIADAVHAYAAATQKPERISINAGLNETDKVAARLAKPFETAVTNGNNQLDKMDEASALIQGNAEAQALGIPKTLTALVSGQGTGVRITMPELQLIAKARGIQGDFEGFIRKVEGQGSLTKTQQQQLTGIIQDTKKRLQEKLAISNEALDKINGGADRNSVVQAEKEARQKFSDLEKTGHYVGQTVTFKDGSQKVITKVHPDGGFDAN